MACGWGLRLQGSVPEPQSPPGLTFLESLLLQTMFPASGRPASKEQRVHPQPSEFHAISPSLSPPHALEMSPHPGPPLSRSPPGTHSRGGGAGRGLRSHCWHLHCAQRVFTHERGGFAQPARGSLEVPTGSACAGGLAELGSGLSFLRASRHLLRASVFPSVLWGQWYPRAQPCPRGSWCNVCEGRCLAQCRTSAGGSFLQAVPMRARSLGPSPPLCSEPMPGTLVPEDSPLLTGRVSQQRLTLCIRQTPPIGSL